VTGVTPRQQRRLAAAIKNARDRVASPRLQAHMMTERSVATCNAGPCAHPGPRCSVGSGRHPPLPAWGADPDPMPSPGVTMPRSRTSHGSIPVFASPPAPSGGLNAQVAVGGQSPWQYPNREPRAPTPGARSGRLGDLSRSPSSSTVGPRRRRGREAPRSRRLVGYATGGAKVQAPVTETAPVNRTRTRWCAIPA
jgi:hypothetical protein